MSITFRPCVPEDVSSILLLMYSSGPKSFKYVFSVTHAEQVLDFLQYAFVQGDGEFGYKSHVVALEDGKIVGIVGMRRGDENFRYTLTALKQIFSFYGFRIALRVLMRGHNFERIVSPPKKHQICLHNFGVLQSMRGKGIGKLMIAYVKEQTEKMGFKEVTLDVAESNSMAKMLYLKEGFEVISFNEGGYANDFGVAVHHETMTLKL